MTNFKKSKGYTISLAAILILLALCIFSLNVLTAKAAQLDVCPGGCAYSSIQAAVNAAMPGDIVNVGAGIYTESVYIDKSLKLLGAKKDVDPRTVAGLRFAGDPSESIIDANGFSHAVNINSSDVEINGFEIVNASGDSIYHSGPILDNLQARYCLIHEGGDEGVQFKDVNNSIIEYNLAYNMTGDGYSFASSSNSFLRHNEVYNSNSPDGAIYLYYCSGLTIENNYIHNNTSSNGIKLYKFENTSKTKIYNNLIENNNFNGKKYSWDGNAIQLYKPFIHPNIDASLEIKFNIIAFNTGQGSGQPAGHDGHGIFWYQREDIGAPINISYNCIFDNGGWGMKIMTDPSYVNAVNNLDFEYNSIEENSKGGLINTVSVFVDALNNWWGCSSGPGFTGCDDVSGNVNFTPWLMSSGICGFCDDNDGDNYYDEACGGKDCNDNNSTINPDSVEICDSIDNDCDDIIDETPWTESANNPVFAQGSLKAYYPSILKISGMYHMWYGTSGAQTAYATSSDGFNWTDHGIVMTDGYHSVVEHFPSGFAGANSGADPNGSIMYFRMWYWDTSAPLYSEQAIGYTESPDGINWYNYQPIQNGTIPIITGSPSDWNRGSYGPADILYNPLATNTGTDWEFIMYYDATTGGEESLGIAFSDDGIVWNGYDEDFDNKADPVLIGSYIPGDWEENYVSRATVIKSGPSDWEMWYSGGYNSMNHGLGYAVSDDGIHWIKDSDNPIFYKDDGVSWREQRSYTPMVIKEGPLYKMWFSGKSGLGDYAIGYAENLSCSVDYMQPKDVLVEGKTNPGIIISHNPYFQARFTNAAPGVIANKYQVQVDDNAHFNSPIWDTGDNGVNMPDCLIDDFCVRIKYSGPKLQPEKYYYVRIRFWDSYGSIGQWSVEYRRFMIAGGTSYPEIPDRGPVVPEVFKVTKIDTDKVVWAFNRVSQATGYRLYDASGNVILDEVPEFDLENGLLYYSEYNLEPNTVYTRRISAYNEYGESKLSDPIKIITSETSITSQKFGYSPNLKQKEVSFKNKNKNEKAIMLVKSKTNNLDRLPQTNRVINSLLLGLNKIIK